jgi:hypothetical protein
MEPVTKFVHTALFKSESGWNELHIQRNEILEATLEKARLEIVELREILANKRSDIKHIQTYFFVDY